MSPAVPPEGDPLPDATHAPSADWSLAEAARQKEIYLALSRKLAFDKARGELVNGDDVEAAVRQAFRATATRILLLPSKLAPRLAAIQTAVEVEEFLRRELTKSLNDMSDEAAARLSKSQAKGA